MTTDTSPRLNAKHLVVINGGPRPRANTATLLRHAEVAAQEAGATTERVNLFDIEFSGCRSCFACKLRGGKSYGQCAQRDALTPVLASIAERADALLIGSPIYIASVTGATRCFQERLLFPWFTYTDPAISLFPRTLRVGTVYTFGATQEVAEEKFEQALRVNEGMMELIFRAPVETVSSYDTLQFDDYSKYVADRFDPVHKANRHREVFPEDCQRARELGKRLVA